MNTDTIRTYLAELTVKRYAEMTIYSRRLTLERFAACGFSVERFAQGLSASVKVQHDELARLRLFLRWCRRDDEAAAIRLPIVPRALPLLPPGPADVDRFLRSVEGAGPVALRDRAMLELIYSSALRSCEVRRLRIGDVDLASGSVRVEGKGGRWRSVPVGRAARSWLTRYLAQARPRLGPASDVLFPGRRGRPLDRTALVQIFERLRKRAGAPSTMTAHALRRAAAAHCQAEGMNARELQELLGHADLKNLERYTGFGKEELRGVLERCHPRWRMRVE